MGLGGKRVHSSACRTPIERHGRKEIPMNGLAVFHAELALLLANESAARHRRRSEHRTTFVARSRWSGVRAIAAAISALPRRLTIADAPESLTPHLSDYPYRP